MQESIAKEKKGVKNVWKFVPLRGGGRLTVNTILNFHFDYWHTSLSYFCKINSTLGSVVPLAMFQMRQHLLISSCEWVSNLPFYSQRIYGSFRFIFKEMFIAVCWHNTWPNLHYEEKSIRNTRLYTHHIVILLCAKTRVPKSLMCKLCLRAELQMPRFVRNQKFSETNFDNPF